MNKQENGNVEQYFGLTTKTIFINKENGSTCEIEEYCRLWDKTIKEWKDGIIYKSSLDGLKYVKELDEFFDEFKPKEYVSSN